MNQKLITCAQCGETWYVVGERQPWSNKRTVAKALLICRNCGHQNTLHPKPQLSGSQPSGVATAPTARPADHCGQVSPGTRVPGILA